MKTTAWIAMAAALLLTAGCAGGPARRHESARLQTYLPYAGPPVREFAFFRLDSWQAVADDAVIIWSTPQTAWLLNLDPCPELAFAERLGVTSTAGTVTTFDALLLRHHERCQIRSIRPLNLRQMQADRAAEKAAAPAAPPR